MPRDGARAAETMSDSPLIRIGVNSSCFTNISTVKPVEVWAQVTRPGGRRLWLVTSLMLRGREVDNLVRSDSVARTEGFRSTTRSRVPPILIAYPQ